MTDPRMTPTNDAPVTVEQCDREAAAQFIYPLGSGAVPTHIADLAHNIRRGRKDDHYAVQAFARHRLAALASAPAEQEAAFRAGAEAMQRALADALRDHLNSRAAAIANSTPLPEYPA